MVDRLASLKIAVGGWMSFSTGRLLGTRQLKIRARRIEMVVETIPLRCLDCGHKWQEDVPLTNGDLFLWDDLCPLCESQGVVEGLAPSSRPVAHSA